MYPELARRFLRWTLLRDALARGWWLATALYMVVVAELSPTQLILIGVLQSLIVVATEIPAGVIADAVSRRLTLVAAHLVMGTGMTMVAVSDTFAMLAVANCLWGLGWALTSGADVAWITDELDRPDLIDRVLTARARRGLVGTVIGILVAGGLASWTTLRTAIGVSGLSMIALGLATVARWPEAGFTPVGAGRRIAASRQLLRRSTRLARGDRAVSSMLVATFLINGADQGFGRIFELHLIDLGLPTTPDPIVWFAGVAVLGAGLGAAAFLAVEARIDGAQAAQRIYVAGCGAGAVGVSVFALAPTPQIAIAGALLVRGIGFPTTRLAATIVVNRRTTSDTRATVHSLLSQAENLGEIVLGLAVAWVALGSPRQALVAAAALVAGAGVVAAARRPR